MKKVTWISIIGIVCLSLVGCSQESNVVGDKSNYEVSNKLATLQVKEGSLTKSKLTLILKNNTDHGCSYGNPFSLEKEKNGVWYEIKPARGLNFTLEAYGLGSKDSIEFELSLESFYKKLSPAKYRVVKAVFCNGADSIKIETTYVAAEFVIE